MAPIGDIENYVKEVKSKHGSYALLKVLKLLRLYLGSPSNFLIQLPTIRKQYVELALSIIKQLRDRNRILEFIELCEKEGSGGDSSYAG